VVKNIYLITRQEHVTNCTSCNIFCRKQYEAHFQWQIKCSKCPHWPARMPSIV